MNANAKSSPRYIALDIHKHYAVVAAVDREADVLLQPRKVANEQLSDWATAHLFAEDRVVIESTTNAWLVHDFLAPLVAEVKVANPIRIQQIAEVRTKIAKRDAVILIPEVWVPPVHVRELDERNLFAKRGQPPNFTDTASPVIASQLVDRFAKEIAALSVPTQTGQFGAHMQVEIHNDGTVTIWMER